MRVGSKPFLIKVSMVVLPAMRLVDLLEILLSQLT